MIRHSQPRPVQPITAARPYRRRPPSSIPQDPSFNRARREAQRLARELSDELGIELSWTSRAHLENAALQRDAARRVRASDRNERLARHFERSAKRFEQTARIFAHIEPGESRA